MPTKKAPAGNKAAAPKAKSGKGAAGGEAAAPGAGGKKPNALQQPLQASKELAAVVGKEPLPRGAVVSKVWAYIKQHQLQNPENRREILADDKLEAVVGAKKVTMFALNKHLARHLK
jgi:chromatin remodeling complex protein RSC6